MTRGGGGKNPPRYPPTQALPVTPITLNTFQTDAQSITDMFRSIGWRGPRQKRNVRKVVMCEVGFEFPYAQPVASCGRGMAVSGRPKFRAATAMGQFTRRRKIKLGPRTARALFSLDKNKPLATYEWRKSCS